MKFLDWLLRRSADPDVEEFPQANQMEADAGLEQAHQLRSSVERRQSRIDWEQERTDAHQKANHFGDMFGDSMRRRPHGSG